VSAFFRDYHLFMLVSKANRIFATTDAMLLKRVRKIGGTKPCTYRYIVRLQTRRGQRFGGTLLRRWICSTNLRDDNKQLVANLREKHGLCDEARRCCHRKLVEVWIDEDERGTCSCRGQRGGLLSLKRQGKHHRTYARVRMSSDAQPTARPSDFTSGGRERRG